MEISRFDRKKMSERSKELLLYLKYVYKSKRFKLLLVTTTGAELYDLSLEEYKLNFRNNREYIKYLAIDKEDNRNLVDKMSTSTSIISTSDSPGNSHDHKLIYAITQEMRELCELEFELKSINSLPQRQKHILIAHGIVGISFDDIAEAMGLSANWVKANYNKALFSLALALPNELFIKK